MNIHTTERLNGLLAGLNSTYAATAGSASASKGAGRANFIQMFLEQVVPPAWRISTNGEVTDCYGSKTGELDVIIENGFFPSLPIIGIDSTRLFFAEGVAAVVEIKSNLQSQWDDVIATGTTLAGIRRKISGGTMIGSGGVTVVQLPVEFSSPSPLRIEPTAKDKFKERIPYFVVGYQGWSKHETIAQKLNESADVVDGILQLDTSFFGSGAALDSVRGTGSLCLLAFLRSVQDAASYLQAATADLLMYGRVPPDPE